MNPAAVTSCAKRGGDKLIGRSLLDCHNPESRDKIQRVVDWFAADKSHNFVYTFHNEKLNKDVYMVALRDEDGILHHQENVDLLPANIELSTLEVTMGNVMSREMIMKEYIDTIRSRYDYILIDCLPSLGMMTINALVSSDSVLIPVQAAYLPVKGLQQLIKTISMVKKRLNRRLTIEGILLTMVDFRTNYAKDIAALVQETYGSQIAIFKNVIPMSVKAAETSAEGISIYTHCPKGKVSMAYMNLTQEVMSDEK